MPLYPCFIPVRCCGLHGCRRRATWIRCAGICLLLVSLSRCIHTQGGGKRKGAFAVYLEPWHADIFAFLDLKKNHGAEEIRARDLFLGLWIPDLFMERVSRAEMDLVLLFFLS